MQSELKTIIDKYTTQLNTMKANRAKSEENWSDVEIEKQDELIRQLASILSDLNRQLRTPSMEPMMRETLLYKLTGTETPKFITEREDVIINKCLDIINGIKQGRKVIDFVPNGALTSWDDIEVQPVKNLGDACEVCDEHEADFWSVYLHQVQGGVQCIADLPSKELAEAFSTLLNNGSKSREQSKEYLITKEIEDEVRFWSDKPMLISSKPFPVSNYYVRRGIGCDFLVHDEYVRVWIKK